MSKKVAIVTDSTVYLEPGEAERLGIHVVPLNIQLGSSRFLDTVDIDTDELFRRLAGRGRADDKPDVIRQRLVAYRKQTEPLLDYYEKKEVLKSIDGLGTVDEIFDRVVETLAGLNDST